MNLTRLSNLLVEYLDDNYGIFYEKKCLRIEVSFHEDFGKEEFKVPRRGIVQDHCIPEDIYDQKETHFDYDGNAKKTLRFVLQKALSEIDLEKLK